MTEPLPLDRSRPLSGRDLRHAALVVVQRLGGGSIGEILDALVGGGFTVAGEHPNKVLADGLRHEVRLGRLRRVGWGRYAIARLAATTARRLRGRWALATDHTEEPTEPSTGAGLRIDPAPPAAVAACAAVMATWQTWRQWRPPERTHRVGTVKPGELGSRWGPLGSPSPIGAA